MTTVSILFKQPNDHIAEDGLSAPAFFGDLNLDQVVAAICDGKEEYNLVPFFSMPLHTEDAVHYRQEVFHDLSDSTLREAVNEFAAAMREVRGSIAETEKQYYEHQNERWILDAASHYLKVVQRLESDLKKSHLTSSGMVAFRDYLSAYLQSTHFQKLLSDTNELEHKLGSIRYELLIEGLRVEVRPYHDEPNYGVEVKNIFERFSQGGRHTLSYSFRDRLDMSQVEGKVLDLLSELYSETFTKLAAYRTAYGHFIDPTIAAFDREVQFYLAYLTYIETLDLKKLSFCYPTVSSTGKAVNASASFDIALARKLSDKSQLLVTNDFYLKGKERIIVVSGPNQGGKTTFARMFGQLHYLASLGLLVPGSEAHLYLPDTIYTHFEEEERMLSLRGKLEDDLVRAHDILNVATSRSIILINEIFASTTLQDAILLSKKVGTSIMKLDALCVWITFIDEVASFGEQTVSMVSTVVPNKPADRTFKIVRRPADGLAYARSIAEKYKLTSTQLERRIHT